MCRLAAESLEQDGNDYERVNFDVLVGKVSDSAFLTVYSGASFCHMLQSHCMLKCIILPHADFSLFVLQDGSVHLHLPPRSADLADEQVPPLGQAINVPPPVDDDFNVVDFM